MSGTVVLTGANGSSLSASDPNTAKLVQLIIRYPSAHLRVEGLDLGSLAAVRSFADSLAARISSKELPPISAIVCNAFTWSLESGQKFTPDGYEATFQDPKLSTITATAMDPGGLVESRAQAGQKVSVQRISAVLKLLMPVLKHITSTFRTNKDAGRDHLAVSLDPAFQGKRGYYVGQKQEAAASVTGDTAVQRRLWEACWQWAGFAPEETVLCR
ncbi:hypothetical protein BDW72DRAFT_192180 [Aspergillus terricola var. indicus]